jgi:hypothetical protein
MHRHEMQQSNIYLGIYIIGYYFFWKNQGVTRKCYNCGQKCHFASVCPNPRYFPDVTMVATLTTNRQANSTASTVQQQFQQMPHPISQGYATPQHQVIKHTSNFETPTTGNQNV